MALVKGTNCGFVTVSPVADPGGTPLIIDTAAAAFKDVAPAGATKVTEIGWWSNNVSEEANFEVGIYDHNVGDNNPEARIGVDDVNAKGTAAGWKKVTGLNIAITEAVTYWIAFQLDNTATASNMNYSSLAGEKMDRKYAQASLPDPWGVSSTSNAILGAIYAVYETGAPPPAAAKFGSLNRDFYGPEQNIGLYTEI